MTQDAIWDHFQNEGLEAFSQASPRLEFLARGLKPGERMLNIGVGSGELERMAAAKGVEVWALDPSERAIARLRASLSLGQRAHVGYGQAMPFPNNYFDTVVMTEVLEHLGDDIRDASLAEVHRVLRAGGRLMGTVPARERLEDSQVICPRCEHHFHRWGHQASFDIVSLNQLLKRFFVPETVEERFFNEWESAGWNRRLSGLLKKFLSWRGLGTYGAARNIFFIAQKPQ
ncbi:MAG: class I SAM-dependent methyltransferase [Sphingomicrobium sp.]